MKIVEGKEEGVKQFKPEFVKQVPKAPAYLNTKAKKYFKAVAQVLIDAERLKDIYLETLAILADNLSQKEWAIREMSAMNRNKPGSGYKQKYNTGATNITTEMVVKRDAEKRILECLAVFGMDPKSDKQLGQKDSGQYDLFEMLEKKMQGNQMVS